MLFTGRVRNSEGQHRVDTGAGSSTNTLDIAPKSGGFGSSVSGGELLMAALATCYCNDIYREAANMGIAVTAVDVECEADFPAPGAPARDIRFTAQITANAPEEKIRELAARADQMAEIQNTVRAAIPALLAKVEARSV